MTSMSRTAWWKVLALVGTISLTASACTGFPWGDLLGGGDEPPADSTVPPTTELETTTTAPGDDTTTTVLPLPVPAPPESITSTTAPPTTVPPTAAPETTTTAPPAPAPSGLNEVELQIFQWTNELRADPDGPLAPDQPISCRGVEVDPASGHPRPLPALTLDETVSIEVARDWAVTMQTSGSFSHRQDIGGALESVGIQWRTYGENIAWEGGHPVAQKAMTHFDGWVNSPGHYCNMMSPGFTHIGVGYHVSDNRSWAVQNFYTPR